MVFIAVQPPIALLARSEPRKAFAGQSCSGLSTLRRTYSVCSWPMVPMRRSAAKSVSRVCGWGYLRGEQKGRYFEVSRSFALHIATHYSATASRNRLARLLFLFSC